MGFCVAYLGVLFFYFFAALSLPWIWETQDIGKAGHDKIKRDTINSSTLTVSPSFPTSY